MVSPHFHYSVVPNREASSRCEADALQNAPCVLLVALPWKHPHSPSIQIGTLHAVLEREGIAVASRHLFVDFLEFMLAAEGLRDPEQCDALAIAYARICEGSFKSGLGDFVFSGPPLRDITPTIEAEFQAFLAEGYGGDAKATFAMAQRMRAYVPAFLDQCVDEIVASGARIVGFTSTFNQTVASLNLAARLKAAKPSVSIVLGGANCDGPMGVALHRNYAFIDYVVRGEGEYVFPELVRRIVDGRGMDDLPGLVFRLPDGSTVAVPHDRSKLVDMNDVPMPNYDAYFERIRDSRMRRLFDQNITVMVESARGCWWGEKNHCTFCGLNGLTMQFRSKDAARFAAEIEALSAKHRRLHFFCVDNIIDYKYFDSLLPHFKAAREDGRDFELFYETKVNLRKRHFAMFRDAGVHSIQPGIESLSTPILKLMNKGTSGLQNIRFLKWAAEYGLSVTWNIITGFPGEDRAEYDKMIDLLPSLAHLGAPNATALLLERFSPYFDRPDAFGIEILGPSNYYRHVYALERTELMDLAYEFEHRCEPGEPDVLVERLKAAVDRIWPNRRPTGKLTCERGPGFVIIVDTRSGQTQSLTLRGRSAAAYLACDAGATVRDLLEQAELADTVAEHLERLLDDLVARRLMYHEDGKYLSLAVAVRPVLAYDSRASESLEQFAGAVRSE